MLADTRNRVLQILLFCGWEITLLILLVKKMYNEAVRGVYYLRIREKTLS